MSQFVSVPLFLESVFQYPSSCFWICYILKYPALSQIEIFVSKDEQEQAKIAKYFENLDNLITLHQREFFLSI